MATGPRVTAKTKIFEFEIVLEGTQPAVRRRVQVPGEVSLAGLHDIVQTAMGWSDDHLHEFELDGVRYGPPERDVSSFLALHDERKVKLFRLLGPSATLTYVYDFGDDWYHTLSVVGVHPPEPGVRYPRCVDGQRACPPEDVGGVGGYEFLLEAIADSSHPEHEERLEWVGGSFDPERFDRDAADAALEWLAWSPLAVPAARGR